MSEIAQPAAAAGAGTGATPQSLEQARQRLLQLTKSLEGLKRRLASGDPETVPAWSQLQPALTVLHTQIGAVAQLFHAQQAAWAQVHIAPTPAFVAVGGGGEQQQQLQQQQQRPDTATTANSAAHLQHQQRAARVETIWQSLARTRPLPETEAWLDHAERLARAPAGDNKHMQRQHVRWARGPLQLDSASATNATDAAGAEDDLFGSSDGEDADMADAEETLTAAEWCAIRLQACHRWKGAYETRKPELGSFDDDDDDDDGDGDEDEEEDLVALRQKREIESKRAFAATLAALAYTRRGPM